MANAPRKLWKIYARAGGSDPEDYAGACRNRGIIAIGWDIGPLARFRSRDEIQAALRERYYSGRSARGACASATGVLSRFLDEVKPGHFVICPDKHSGMVYVGEIGGGTVGHYRSPPDTLPFVNWRPVRWRNRPLTAGERRILLKGGGNQTLTEIRVTPPHWLMREVVPTGRSRKVPSSRSTISVEPDKEFGRAAEIRAMEWLRERGLRPVDVARFARGWDFECGDQKYEVKSRKSDRTKVRLSHNEWKAACRHRKEYFLLLFTARSIGAMRRADPRLIPDPTQTVVWKERCVVEHFLESY